MTTTTRTRDPAAAGQPASTRRGRREPWTGVADLLRLYLRLDRLRILIWALALGLTLWSSVIALQEAFPDAESRQARAGLMSNPAAVLMSGPAFGLDDYTFGAMVANELGLTLLVAVAIMSILLAVRHTRAEEESGRMETVRALPVGAFAPAVAALLAVCAANLAVAAAVLAGLLGTGMTAADSVVFALGLAATGLVFGAVAAVTAQVTEHARSATGMALAVLGAAFLTRGVGDVIEPTGSWLSWTSPIAWAQQTRLYVDLRAWPLLLSLAVTAVLLVAAVLLAGRRDLGAGLRAPRPGPAQAAASLPSVGGIARRLLRGNAVAWGTGLFLCAIVFGALADSIGDALADLPDLGDWIGIDLDQLTESFAATMLLFVLLGVLAQAVTGVLRWRAEDDAGRAALLLVAGESRPRALLSWLAVVGVQAVVLTALSGLGLGLGVAAVTDDWSWVGGLTVAALAYLPGVAVGAGVAAALVAWFPRAASLVWVLVLWAVLVTWFGELLGIPEWARNLSPLNATPMVPMESLGWQTLGLLTGLAVALVAAAVVGFRRRDLLA